MMSGATPANTAKPLAVTAAMTASCVLWWPDHTPSGPSRPEAVAKVAVGGAMHDGLRSRELDLGRADRGDVEVDIADEEAAQLRLAERLEEFGVSAARDVELPSGRVVEQPLGLGGVADARAHIGPDG